MRGQLQPRTSRKGFRSENYCSHTDECKKKKYVSGNADCAHVGARMCQATRAETESCLRQQSETNRLRGKKHWMQQFEVTGMLALPAIQDQL